MSVCDVKYLQCAFYAQFGPLRTPGIYSYRIQANIYISNVWTVMENGDIHPHGVLLSCADALLQSQSDAESQRSNMEREDTRSSPSSPSTPSVCSPISSISSVPSTGKNVCASCGQEIVDRYLLKVRGREEPSTRTGSNHTMFDCVFFTLAQTGS